MKKKLLQISNDFADQKIYINLVRKLSNQGYEQIVYVPIRWESKIDGNRDDSIENVVYHYSYILKPNLLFKLRYYRKLRIILKDLESKVNVNDIGLVHAHFLFSDGGVAYWLKKKYNLPYVVSVRATDIHYFFRIMPHLRVFGNKIMQEAEKVIFINHPYKQIFEKKYLKSFYFKDKEKFKIIPNAIDDRWFEKEIKKKKIDDSIKLLYVGRIIKRKKLDIVIKALNLLNDYSNSSFVLEIVGDGPHLEEIKKIPTDSAIFHGKISDFEEVRKIYTRSHIFVMPALKETFGLVYIEALSQGLPIIFCKNEGVDGFFENDEVGCAIVPENIKAVKDAVLKICENYEAMSSRAVQVSKKFNWATITQGYIDVYETSKSK